jgi:hypothetical protein
MVVIAGLKMVFTKYDKGWDLGNTVGALLVIGAIFAYWLLSFFADNGPSSL